MKRLTTLLFAVGVTLAPVTASAQLFISSSNGNVYDLPGPVTDQVNANQMGAFKLTARWGNHTEVSNFGFIAGTTWGFQSENLNLLIDGSADTWFTFWTGSNNMNGLTSLEFDAAGTNVLFDRTYLLNLLEGTPGSNIGYDGDYGCDGGFLAILFCELGTTVNYTDAARFSPDEPVGDLYRKMTFNFAGNGVNEGLDLAFVRFDTDITQLNTVPEPSTYVLMAAGLAGLGVAARRRRQQA